MYPAQFEYHTPGTVREALDLLGRHKDDAKLLAGGHSLLPAMKLRLAQPKHLVDLRKVSGLSGIKEDGGSLVIGAMTTHYQVESSAVVKSKVSGVFTSGKRASRSRWRITDPWRDACSAVSTNPGEADAARCTNSRTASDASTSFRFLVPAAGTESVSTCQTVSPAI